LSSSAAPVGRTTASKYLARSRDANEANVCNHIGLSFACSIFYAIDRRKSFLLTHYRPLDVDAAVHLQFLYGIPDVMKVNNKFGQLNL